jgi:predicted unusual protein kinase regulating ubiquinone biosynthesis (AarF/ABC1/UbiB family)
LQETDYIKEADSTEEYYRLLKGDPRFVVPKVYRDFSNKRVIATSFETGLRVDDPTIKNLSQDRRNRIALNFMELYFKEIFQWKFVQTDPHFGNYRIRLHQKGEDQIVLFDFGATRQYPDSFMGPYHRMIKAMFYNNDEDFEKAAHDLKLLQKGDTPELVHVFKELCFDIVEPFLLPDDPRNKVGRVEADGTYDWKKTDLPQRSTRKVKTMLADFQWRTPPREFIFLDRKAAGVFIFLSHLGAKIQGRELLEKYLKQV